MNLQPLGTGDVPFHPSDPQLFEHISSYSFHTDSDYQSGLSAILGHPETPATEAEILQNQDLVLQAQCFYLARRYGLPTVDIAGYQRWLSNQQDQPDTQPSTQPHTEDPPPSIPTAIPSTATAAPPSPFPRPRAPTPNTAAQATTHPLSPSPSTTTEPLSSTTEANTANSPNTLPTPSSDAVPPYPTTFADIVTLITENRPIPGIQEIPATILEPGSSKQDTASRRRKPWEKNLDDQDTNTNDGETNIPSASVDASADTTTNTQIDTNKHRETGEGVLKILQPGAVPDSGLIAKE